jgi:hypothetical protein
LKRDWQHCLAGLPDGAASNRQRKESAMQLRRTLQLAVTFLSITTFLLAFAVPQASAQITCELHEKGFWRNNPADWPVTSLQLGSNTYTQQQLLTILATRVGGDASVMLAQQLIAALLNIENGTDPSPVDTTIDHANSLLGGDNS